MRKNLTRLVAAMFLMLVVSNANAQNDLQNILNGVLNG